MKIIFLDIDGPMIPRRAFYMAGQTSPYATVFDPCAVGLLNDLCLQSGAKIAVHSFWRRVDMGLGDVTLREHLISQGIKEEYFHEDWQCPMKLSSTRWHDIQFWLSDHPETENFVILEDEVCYTDEFIKHVCKIDYDEGLTFERAAEAYMILMDTKVLPGYMIPTVVE